MLAGERIGPGEKEVVLGDAMFAKLIKASGRGRLDTIRAPLT